MENSIYNEELEIKKQQLREDIQYVENNLYKISCSISKEIEKLQRIKSLFNIGIIETLKIDASTNTATISNVADFERQLALAVEQRTEKIIAQDSLVKHLVGEHTRISGVKKSLERQLDEIEHPKKEEPKQQDEIEDRHQFTFFELNK